MLRSERHLKESHYENYISNNTTDELKDKINNIRMLLVWLGDIVTKSDRDKIRKKLYEIENKQNLQKHKKLGIITILLN